MKLNNKGFSLAEIVVATALMGFVALLITSLVKQADGLKKDIQSDDEISQAFKNIQSILSYSENNNSCENLLSGGLTKSNLTVISENGNLGPYGNGSKIGNSTSRVLSIDTNQAGDTGQGKTRVRVTVTFEKKVAGNTRKIQKSFVRPVVVTGSVVKCLPVDTDQVDQETMETVCSEIGGSVVSGSCDVNAGSFQADFREKLKVFACSLFGGSGNNYVGGLCEQLTVTDHAKGQNIDEDFICINSSECREQFDASSCPSGQYLSQVSSQGIRSCKGITFSGSPTVTPPTVPTLPPVTPPASCTPDCSCADSLDANKSCIETTCNTSCPGKLCNYLDSYKIVGSQCRYRDYASISSGCTSYTDSFTNAPECKTIVSTSCIGSTPAIYVNQPTGTPCSNGGTCDSGVCKPPVSGDCAIKKNETWDMVCSGGSLSFFPNPMPSKISHGQSVSYTSFGFISGTLKLKCNNGNLEVVSKSCGASGGLCYPCNAP